MKKRTAAPGTSTVNGVSGLSDAQEVRAPATTASAAMVKREPVGAQEGSASVHVKGAPINVAPLVVDAFDAAIVRGALINAASSAMDVSSAAIVTGTQINAALPAAGLSVTASQFAVAVMPCVTEAINASVAPQAAPARAAPAGERFSDLNIHNVEWDAILTCPAEVIEGT